MPTTATTLVQRVRRFVGDWPELDTVTASVSSGGTSISVADTTKYAVNWLIQLDQEMLRVTALTNATTLAVARGARGTTAATHVTATSVLVRPQFSDQEILDGLNAGIGATFPYFYKPVLDTSLIGDGATYEYTIPSTLPYLSKVESQDTGSPYYARIDSWTVRRAATPKIQFASPPLPGTLRLHGYGPLPELTSFVDTLDAMWPSWGDDPLVEYAANRLLMSSEAQRVRLNSGPQDDSQAGPRQGVGAQIATQLLQRFYQRLAQAPMPPMPKHIVRVF